jgi:trigger factor
VVTVTSERLPDAQVVLQIEVEPEAVEKATQRAYQSLASRVKIPGFRPGKAPRYLVERYVGGADVLRQEGIERAIPDAYREALTQADVQPIDQPEIEVVSTDPLKIKATVSVQPTVEPGEYRSIRVPKLPVDVPYERINDTIERLREQHTQWTPVERAAQAGDRVTADVVGTIGATPTLYDPAGQPIMNTEGGEELLNSKNAEIEVNPESQAPVPGFHEQLVGVRPQSEKRFVLSLPADWPNEAQRSKSVLFQVQVHEVKEGKAPALNDEFARSVGPEYETFEALREDIRNRLRAQLEHDAEHAYEDSVIKAAVEQAKIEMPPALVRRENERLVRNFEQSLARQRLSLDQYLQLTKKSADELREELRPQAEANLRSFLLLREIGNAEGVQIAPHEIDAEIERMLGTVVDEEQKQARQILERPEQREDIEASLWHRKVVRMLMDVAQQEGTPASAGPADASEVPADASEEAEKPKPKRSRKAPTQKD